MESELPKNVASLDEGISESNYEMQDVVSDCTSEEHNQFTSCDSASDNEIERLLMPKSLSEKETLVIRSISSSNSSMSESFEDDAAHSFSETLSFESLPKDFNASMYDVHQDSEGELKSCELNAPADQNSENENNNCKFDVSAADEVSRTSLCKVECDLESVPVHCSVVDTDECSFTPVSTCKSEISIDDKKKQNDGLSGTKESAKQIDVRPKTKETARQSGGQSGTKESIRQSDSYFGTKESTRQTDGHPERKEGAGKKGNSGTIESARQSDSYSGTKESARQSDVHPDKKEGAGKSDGYSGTKESARQSHSHSGTKESAGQSDVHPERKEGAGKNDGHSGTKESSRQSDGHPERKEGAGKNYGHSGTIESARQSDSHSGTKESAKQNDVHPERKEGAWKNDSHSGTKESGRQSNGHSGTKESARQNDSHSGTKESTRQNDVHPETKSAGLELNDKPHFQSGSPAPNCTGMSVACIGSDKTVDTVKENSSQENKALFYVHPHIHSYPCCAHATSLYNQCGKLCTLFDKRYIFTKVHQAPVLVCLESEDSEVIPSQVCRILWRENTPLVLSELEDGTELMFDAMVLSESKKYVALVAWRKYKPDVVPLLSEKWSMLLLEEVTGFQVKFSSYCLNNGGFVRAVVNGQEVDISYSFEEVFVNGKRARNVGDVMMLSQLHPTLIYITANKFFLLTDASEGYIYMATCIWNGVKPIALSLQPPLHRGKVYSTPDTDSNFQEVSNYSKLYFDIPCHLSLKKVKGTVPPTVKEFKLKFFLDNEMKSVCCTTEKLFWGDSQVTEIKYPLPPNIKVKAHILKQRLGNDQEKWKVILVQVFSENVAVLSPDSDIKGRTQEMDSKNICSSSLKSVIPTSHSEVPCDVAGANLTAACDVSVALRNPSDSSINPQSTTIIHGNLNTNVLISTDSQLSNNTPSSFVTSLHSTSSSCSSQVYIGSSVSPSNSHASCQISSTMSNTTYCNSESLPAVKAITDQNVQKVYQPDPSSEESQIQPQKPDNAVTEKSRGTYKRPLYRVLCTIEKVAKSSGIVKSRGKILGLDNAMAHFRHTVLFINGRIYSSNSSLSFSTTVEPYIGKECTCLLEVCKPQKICNETVHFMVCLMWIGKTPVDKYDFFANICDIEVISLESSLKIQKTSSQVQTLSTVQSTLLQSDTMSKVSPQKGIITVVAVTVGTVQSCEAGSKGELVFDRTKCFLFNVSLQNVALNDVIPTGISVEYEKHGGKVIKVYVGNTYAEADSQGSATRYYLMSAWCQQYDVPLETKEKLLLSIGWLPPELEPVAADDTDLVDIP